MAFSGSSKISNEGFSIKACAMASRCFIPCEYFPTATSSSGFSPTLLMVSSTSLLPVLPRMEAKSNRLSSPLSPGRNPVESSITPMSRGNFPFSIFSPPTKISPASGSAKPHIIFSSTLLPEPFSPTIPQISPLDIFRFRLVNNTLFLYAFDTFRSSTIFPLSLLLQIPFC